MTKYRDVGRSWRTIAKHDLMNSFVGQEVGSAGRMREVDGHVWQDLSAGDAAPIDGVEWHKACSPGILAYHATRATKPVDLTLHEIKPNTYDRLVSNLHDRLSELEFEKDGEAVWRFGDRVVLRAVNGSGHDADVSMVRHRDAVLVLNDPNAITEWAMRDSFAREIATRTRWFRSLSTMGCNPAGLKRLDLAERQGWFGLIGAQQAALPRHRDLLLAAIERDDAQWAYLLSTAVKWIPQTESVVKTAFRRTGRTAALAWYRQDSGLFEETKRALFLTKKERGDAA